MGMEEIKATRADILPYSTFMHWNIVFCEQCVRSYVDTVRTKVTKPRTAPELPKPPLSIGGEKLQRGNWLLSQLRLNRKESPTGPLGESALVWVNFSGASSGLELFFVFL